jgi:dinuclear metal center YbgI/SA1388 family protein
MKVKDFLDIIECLAPSGLALDWDNSGLQVGDPLTKVRHAALALDPTSINIRQALELDCQLLITHHPLIFKPIKSLNFSNPVTYPVCLAMSKDLAVISAHTNWDATGVSHELADILKLTNRRPLSGHGRRLLKLVVFVPTSHEDVVRQAIFETGAGTIGNYDNCFFKATGQGGFKVPLGANPFCGQPGSECTTPESRLEIILSPDLRDAVDAVVRSVHPYEEPAFEFYEVTTTGPGLGMLGNWEPPLLGRQAEELLMETIGSNGLWAGPVVGQVRTLALLPGSGGDFILNAKKAGADLLVTGDVNHHQALLASEIGLPVFSVGHFETERPSLYRLARELTKQVNQLGGEVKLTVLPETSPFRRI